MEAVKLDKDERAERKAEIKARIAELDERYRDSIFPDAEREEWNALNEEHDRLVAVDAEEEKRSARIAELAQNGDARSVENGDGAAFSIGRPGVARGEDIFDLTSVRATSDAPLGQEDDLRDRVLRMVERARFPHPQAERNREEVQAHVEGLIERTHQQVPGQTARFLLERGSPIYKRAFRKALAGQPLSGDETRALGIGTQGGGLGVPVTLDPTIIPTGNLIVNPFRALARVVSITGSNTWNGVSSPDVAATRIAEFGPATDNSPTFIQPTATVTKAHVFIPYSVEMAEDWTGIEGEFAQLISDAKDIEEGTAFATGAGTGVNPQGIVTGTTTTVAASTGLTVTAANLYALEAALPPRFRPNESFVANRGIYNVVRAIDTAGGAALWLYVSQGLTTQAPTPGNTGATLLGRGAWESSAMQATVVNATKIMIVGDFNYFLIVDRIGMTIQNIPFLFGGAQGNLPTGQQGLYAWWRNTSRVLSASAFVALTGTT